MAVASVAVVLFTVGVHWVGRTSYRSPDRKWRWRWSILAVVLVFILFASGIGLVGIVHQIGWLATADEPLTGTTLKQPFENSSPSNLRSIGMAYWNRSSEVDPFPAGGTFGPDGIAMHSWETYLLPYLSYDSRAIDLKRPWHDPKNEQAFKSVVPDSINPGFRTAAIVDEQGYGLSHYAANIHVLGPNRSVGVSGMQNGTSNTILVGEVNSNFKPWGDPVNWRDPSKGINTAPNGFGGPQSARGAYFLMADGSARFISEKAEPQVLKALSNLSRLENPDIE